jgi:alpha-N-arabinofuranosidase
MILTGRTINMTINADLGRDKISRHIYGHFSEHLGRCIYDGFWVGDDSRIPNVRGIRQDIVQALRNIAIPNLRWPGGCFADEYHWKQGIGPNHQRSSILNTHWGGVVETNHFGTHEFMDLCEQMNCEPYICGNVGSGSVLEMQEWIEYLTFNGDSPLAKLRRKNGHDAPWRVRMWGVGNENWGCGGQMRPEFYADQYRRYATYCRNLSGNQLYKIACGANSDDYRWTQVLMREAGNHMDGLSLHYYTVTGNWQDKGSATDFTEEEWFKTLKNAGFMDDLITRHGTIMDEYDPDKRVGLYVDEWGTWHDVEPGTNPRFLYQQNTLRDALVAGLTLNIFNKHCDRVSGANIAQTVNVLQAMILTQGEEIVLTPTYHVFDMYKVHQDAILLPIDIQAQLYTFGEQGIPAISASASRADDGKVHISLCNLDPNQPQKLECELRGMNPVTVSGRILTSTMLNAHNTFQNSHTIEPVSFSGMSLRKRSVEGVLPPKSVAVLELT